MLEKFQIALCIPDHVIADAVLRPVGLHSEASIKTDKIQDVAKKRSLPAEMKTLLAQFAQPDPKFHFLRRETAT